MIGWETCLRLLIRFLGCFFADASQRVQTSKGQEVWPRSAPETTRDSIGRRLEFVPFLLTG